MHRIILFTGLKLVSGDSVVDEDALYGTNGIASPLFM